MSDASKRNPRKRGRRIAFLMVLLVLGAVCASLWHWRKHREDEAEPQRAYATDDPRLLYRGPYTNVHPDAVYANNDNRCVPCHADLCASYRLHPMARSLMPMADRATQEPLDAEHHNPFSALGYRFSLERRGQEIFHRLDREDAQGRSILHATFPVHYALGSGTRGRSYLTNRDGFLFQTPISWFSQKQIWDLSPGFQASYLSGRPVDGQCLFCHANRAHFRENSINHFENPIFSGLGIGCERCHGPAQRHIDTQAPTDIVNPRRLDTAALRDSVCEQCHLKGKMRVLRRGRGENDYRPGLPLSQFFRIFVASSAREGKSKSVSEAEQMHESRCYQATNGTERPLVCVSCHDPHRLPQASERVAHYRTRCLQCHASIPCRLEAAERHRRQADDSCIACHMPRFGTADIVHTAATNHRIPRIPAKSNASEQVTQENLVLKPFHPYPPEEEADVRRDLGLAWVELMKDNSANPQVHGEFAESLLLPAVRQHPSDIPTHEALGFSMFLRGRDLAALDHLETALRLDPERELSLNTAAVLAWRLGRTEESIAYWRRLVSVNPWQPAYRRAMTEILMRVGDRAEARTQCQVWSRLDPLSVEALRSWIYLLLRDKRQEEAREHLRQLEALKAPELESVRSWFDEAPR